MLRIGVQEGRATNERVGPLRAGLAVDNSVSLGVFLAVAADDRTPFAVVEPAGRGVTASAATNRWVLEFGKPSLDGSRWRTT